MTRRALVVDDDRSMVKTLSDVLRFQGWDVTTALSGAAAVKAVSLGHYDVVLMDFKMPGMDGVTAFKAIKHLRPSTRVVIMSAYLAYDMVQEAEREGVLRVLAKPVDIAALLKLLADGLGNRRSILLVDSDAAFLKSLAEVLALSGFETVTAATISQAMQALRDRPTSAVLLHLHLADKNTQELVTQLKRASPSVAFVVYSGQAGAEEEAHQSLPAGLVHAYLQKPFAVEQVMGVLDDIRDGN